LFFSGRPFRILKAWQSGQFILFASPEILDEYERVIRELSQKKSTFDADKAIAFIREKVRLAKPTLLPQQICDDPDDDKFIACALTVKAIIVTGDKALLRTMGFKHLAVMTPALFERQYLI
jgi:putative PIN family toxin of toxin-antitoxin system